MASRAAIRGESRPARNQRQDPRHGPAGGQNQHRQRREQTRPENPARQTKGKLEISLQQGTNFGEFAFLGHHGMDLPQFGLQLGDFALIGGDRVGPMDAAPESTP